MCVNLEVAILYVNNITNQLINYLSDYKNY